MKSQSFTVSCKPPLRSQYQTVFQFFVKKKNTAATEIFLRIGINVIYIVHSINESNQTFFCRAGEYEKGGKSFSTMPVMAVTKRCARSKISPKKIPISLLPNFNNYQQHILQLSGYVPSFTIILSHKPNLTKVLVSYNNGLSTLKSNNK